MESMHKSGRVLVLDAPAGSAASRLSEKIDNSELPTYEELVHLIAVECDGMSGASLAGVARAAASRALERAVTDFAGHISATADADDVQNTINDCLVTQEDFEKAVDDVFESAKAEEYEEHDIDQPEEEPEDDINNTASVVSDDVDTATDLDIDADTSPKKELTAELSSGYADVSEHESVTEYFRAGVEIPMWQERPVDKSSSGGSLRDLLPKRKPVWLKLDSFGRRIEDTNATNR